MLSAGVVARADSNDLVLSRFGKLINGGTSTAFVAGQNLEFRAMASELGVVIAPELLTPSDTIGFGGFELTATMTSTSINSAQSYWRVLQSSTDPTGTAGTSNGAGSMTQVGAFMHKGFWFPVPSIEFGAGVTHILDSSMWTAQGYVKLAVQEGFHHLPLPSIAVRGAVSRLLGQSDLDMSVGSLDISVAKHFGIGGSFSITPYAGWNMLFIVPHSGVLDATPNIDPLATPGNADSNSDFVLKDQATITRQRLFLGAKFQTHDFTIAAEVQHAFAGSSTDTVDGATTTCVANGNTENCNSPDTSQSQTTWLVSVGTAF